MTSGPPSSSVQPPEVSTRIAGSAANFAGRRIALLVISAIGTTLVTRFLGPNHYGQYASALATWTLLSAAADFGFSLVLARDLAGDRGQRPALLRAAYDVGSVWSVALTLVLVGLALASDISSPRGQTLLVLAPSVLTLGMTAGRQVFVALYRTRELVLIDLGIVAVQVLVQVAVAAAGAGPVAVAAVVSVGTTANAVAVGVLARRIVGRSAASAPMRRSLIRRAAPLGLMAIMTKVYLMIDLVILGWLVTGPRLGDYAAAAKMLTLVASVPALITNVALPGLAAHAGEREELSALARRLWEWMLVVSLPVLILTIVFTPLVIEVTIGPEFDGAVDLLRILSIAGVLGVVSNLVGTILVAKSVVRPLVIQNAVAIALNVAANLALVPSYGVAAAAWITVATEAVICAGGLIVLSRHLPLGPWLRSSPRPVGAALVGVAAGLPLVGVQVVGATIALTVFAGVTWWLGAWPPEFSPARLRARRSAA
ncbi:MAG TPA: oligosaccharide flippase family protein [Baekduia sp.]|nr:oligosaccharide flippase family protein [Baekduia sp.]